jgi:hypothetical protein
MVYGMEWYPPNMSILPIEIIREIVSYISPNIDLRRCLGMYNRIDKASLAITYTPWLSEDYSKTVIGAHDYRDFLSGRRRVLPVQYRVEREYPGSMDLPFRYPVQNDCVVADIIVNETGVLQELGIFVLRLGSPPSENHENILPVYNLPNVYWSSVFSQYIRY